MGFRVTYEKVAHGTDSVNDYVCKLSLRDNSHYHWGIAATHIYLRFFSASRCANASLYPAS